MTVFRPRGLSDPAWQVEASALDLIYQTLENTNIDRARHGLPVLMDADMTVAQRVNAVGFVLGGPQTPESVAAAGAQVVSLLAWMLRAENMRPELGDAPAFNPLGGASRGVGRCICAAGPGTNPGCQVHP